MMVVVVVVAGVFQDGSSYGRTVFFESLILETGVLLILIFFRLTCVRLHFFLFSKTQPIYSGVFDIVS